MQNDTANDQKATLGCGSLILIALIVIIVSKGRSEEIEKDLQRIESKIDQQGREIASLRQKVEQLLAETTPPTQPQPAEANE